jgi:hypothetical protein
MAIGGMGLRQITPGGGRAPDWERRRTPERSARTSCRCIGGPPLRPRRERLSTARVSATSDLQGVASGFDWYLDRVVHFNRPGRLPVDQGVVRAPADLRPMALWVSFSVAGTLESLSVDPFACSVVTTSGWSSAPETPTGAQNRRSDIAMTNRGSDDHDIRSGAEGRLTALGTRGSTAPVILALIWPAATRAAQYEVICCC